MYARQHDVERGRYPVGQTIPRHTLVTLSLVLSYKFQLILLVHSTIIHNPMR